MANGNNINDTWRRECADKALHCFGTAYIFEIKAMKMRRKLTVLNFLGIATPVAVGSIIGTFKLIPELINIMLAIAGVIGMAQLIMSVWSLTAKWEDRLSYYLQSKSENYQLASKFEALSKDISKSINSYKQEMQILTMDYQHREKLDSQYDILDSEKRMGMCAALRQYQRKCVTCGNVPQELKSTDCGTCGNWE